MESLSERHGKHVAVARNSVALYVTLIAIDKFLEEHLNTWSLKVTENRLEYCVLTL